MSFSTKLLYKVPSRLPDELISSMISYVETLHYQEGSALGDPDRIARKSTVSWIPWDEWIPGIIYNMMHAANKEYFNYDLDYFNTKIQSTIYNGNSSDHYTWHVDNDDNSVNQTTGHERKLSCSLLLTDASEYEGGELQFHYERTFFKSVRPLKGECYIFPAWVPHRVRPVRSGKRVSIVAWMAGPPFK